MLKVFISHASRNAWAIEGLTKLIAEVNPSASIFCSSSEDSVSPIDIGGNYKKAIYTSLHNADVFVAVVSREFWKSRYCILELGAAYQRYRFDKETAVSIQPMLLPPLARRLALANTPMTEMQVASLINPKAIERFLHGIEGPGGIPASKIKARIEEYAASIRRHLLAQTSLTADAQAGAYFDERPENPHPREQVVRYRSLDDDFLFEFHLSQLPYTPTFASVALEYWDEINFREYLAFDLDAAFCFDLDNIGGALRSVTVEFKFGDTHRVYQAIDCPLTEGANSVCIPLAMMDKKPLSQINQICFVVHPETMDALDGKVIISKMRVDFAMRNIFEEFSGEEVVGIKE